MPIGEIVRGQNRSWSLIQKLGEGDAGEVFLVESLIDRNIAVLKRPARSAFTVDVIRQARQINTEGKILGLLNKVFQADSTPHKQQDTNSSINKMRFCVPSLVDISETGTEFSDRYFIIIAKAVGINLKQLSMLTQQKESENIHITGNLELFINTTKGKNEIPDLLLLRILDGFLDFIHRIHHYSSELSGQEISGILWNDFKPDHLFWDIDDNRITVIDWGNSQLLNSNGTSIDKRFSIADDFLQFTQVNNAFFGENNLSLQSTILWPLFIENRNDLQSEIQRFHESILNLLVEKQKKNFELRSEEETITQSSTPSIQNWERLIELQFEILISGELPNWKLAHIYANQLLRQLVIKGDWKSFQDVIEQAKKHPESEPERWMLVKQVAQVSPWPGLFFLPIQQAILACLSNDWAEVLWQLRLTSEGNEFPAWWHEISIQIRNFSAEISPEILMPLVVFNRLILTLQALDSSILKPSSFPENFGIKIENDLLQSLKNIAIRWREMEPSPPNSGLLYTEVDELIPLIQIFSVDQSQLLDKTLEQPRAFIKIILDAWNRKDFITAQKGLRRLFLWDPDRQRVFLAERAIASAPGWWDSLRKGPLNGESLLEFVTKIEFHGSEMRNQVGNADWLDHILEAFARLRKGSSPSDILLEYQELRSEASWLSDYHPPRLNIATGPIVIERGLPLQKSTRTIETMKLTEFGKSRDFQLFEPLDTWIPESRGSSARVFSGRSNNDVKDECIAMKIMRPDKVSYALPLFREEAEILFIMNDVPGISSPLELGFIKFDSNQIMPSDERSYLADEIKGEILRIPFLEIKTFLIEMDQRISAGWYPYLAFTRQSKENNLIFFCDTGKTNGRYLPLKQSLSFSIQILDVLQEAHARNIVYRDHKIIHYYWIPEENSIKVIDWNVARRIPEGLTSAEKKFDIVQFGARTLHHIMTGRPAPGALPVGPTRPDEIEKAASFYEPHWTFDDQRLPTRLKELIEKTLSGEFDQVYPLRKELEALFHELPENA